MEAVLLESLAEIDPQEWNALVGDASPFLEWGWLASLEESGCVSAETGWLPRHLVLRDRSGTIAACPLYVKSHSLGEFVFDHAWAEAAERARIRYYPKLLVASPFTPVTGARFLVRPDHDRTALIRSLGEVLKELCRQGGFSSVHVNFCLPDEVSALGAVGYELRRGYQFQWVRQGWRTFEDFLGALRNKRRTQIRRERREVASRGIEVSVHAADDIPDELFPVLYRLYRSTVDKFGWSRPHLNERLFELLRQRWKHRLCVLLARRDGTVVAGTLNVRKGPVLYGRYWGAFEEIPFLHFQVCYYAAIEYCLREGIDRFEPGAGGEFKFVRGFDVRPTASMHFIADPRLAGAIATFLARERAAVERRIAWMNQRSEIRRREVPSV